MRRFPTVLREIVDRLLAGDWCRFSTQDESSIYYVIGVKARDAELSGDVRHAHCEFSGERTPSAVGETLARSQLAGSRPDYLKDARRELERAGVESAAIDRFVATGELDLRFRESIPPLRRMELVQNLLQACLARLPNMVDFVDEEDRDEAQAAREKLCLREILGKYEKIVSRWEQLEHMDFIDPQLEEATRCFMYSFRRAAVTLSVSVLETHLKRATCTDLIGFDLVDRAYKEGKINRQYSEDARAIIRTRNRVVHDNEEPDSNRTQHILDFVRMLTTELAKRA